ncbi:hypothetical protein B0O99DRAFT_688347 [Bisporella sp. PMI_857]|nr:hypothetical protein B0O99DRAFT_688347 [Bisporella sp. PMI_857]
MAALTQTNEESSTLSLDHDRTPSGEISGSATQSMLFNLLADFFASHETLVALSKRQNLTYKKVENSWKILAREGSMAVDAAIEVVTSSAYFAAPEQKRKMDNLARDILSLGQCKYLRREAVERPRNIFTETQDWEGLTALKSPATEMTDDEICEQIPVVENAIMQYKLRIDQIEVDIKKYDKFLADRDKPAMQLEFLRFVIMNNLIEVDELDKFAIAHALFQAIGTSAILTDSAGENQEILSSSLSPTLGRGSQAEGVHATLNKDEAAFDAASVTY